MMSTEIMRSPGTLRVCRAGLPWLALLLLVSVASADSRTRRYDFEEGTISAAANTVEDKISTHLTPAFDTFFSFDHLVPGTNDPVPPGQPLKTWITANVDPTPALTTAPGATNGGMFVASNSPAPGSTIALQFDGSSQALQGPGFRDSYVDQAAYNSDAPASGGNLATTFFQLSQAWVYPSSAGQGTEQVVWAVGEENGGVMITSDGRWQLTSVGAAISASTAQVSFDQWTHIAVSRGGGGATLRVNGSVAATASGSFSKWGDFVTLGADENLTSLFNGKVDNFDIGGNSDGSFVPFTDLTFFSDLGIPQPTGVAGDVDQDGDADQNDYNIWSTNAGFNNTFGIGDVTTLIKGDLNNDGRIDFFDFRVIAGAVAAGGGTLDLSSGNVPEPHTLALLAGGAIAVCLRRRERTAAL